MLDNTQPDTRWHHTVGTLTVLLYSDYCTRAHAYVSAEIEYEDGTYDVVRVVGTADTGERAIVNMLQEYRAVLEVSKGVTRGQFVDWDVTLDESLILQAAAEWPYVEQFLRGEDVDLGEVCNWVNYT